MQIMHIQCKVKSCTCCRSCRLCLTYLGKKSIENIVIVVALPRIIVSSVSEQSQPLHTTATHLQFTYVCTVWVVFFCTWFFVFLFFGTSDSFSALSYSLYHCVNCFSVFALFVRMEIIIIIIIMLVQEIGRRTTVITQDTRETVFLFQRLSIALQRGNAVSFLNTMNAE